MTSTPTRPVDNVVITTKGLQDRNIHIIDETAVENKGKLILIVVLAITILYTFIWDCKITFQKYTLTFIKIYLTNSMAYGTQRFNAAFTRALQ